MNIKDLRLAVVSKLLQTRPGEPISQIIESADEISKFVLNGCHEEQSPQTKPLQDSLDLCDDIDKQLDKDLVMAAFIQALPNHSGSLAFYLKKHGVLI